MKIPDWIPAKNPNVLVGEIYIKDASFESPHSPLIFRRMHEGVQLTVTPTYHIKVSTIPEGWYEIVLSLTVSTTFKEEHAYVVEVDQAGLFFFNHIGEDEVHQLVGSYCPRFLFPFAREAVASLVQKGGFKQLLMPPIEFDVNFSPLRVDADSKESNSD